MHRQTSTNNAMRLPVLPLLRKMPFKVMAGAGMGGGAFMKAQMVQPEGFTQNCLNYITNCVI